MPCRRAKSSLNLLGDCLDFGFGGERLQQFLDSRSGKSVGGLTRSQVLTRTIRVLLDSGVRPGNTKQGYVLRALLREQIRKGEPLPRHPLIDQERERRERVLRKIPQLLRKHPNRSREYFWQTHGVHPDDWDG